MRGESRTYASLGVVDAEALRLALGAGWHRTLPEACDPPVVDMLSPLAVGPVVTPAEIEEAALASPFLPDAAGTTFGEPPNDPPMTRAELDAEAKRLGIKTDKRTTDADMAKKIADTLARAPHMKATP